jgi:hypothetical protein
VQDIDSGVRVRIAELYIMAVVRQVWYMKSVARDGFGDEDEVSPEWIQWAVVRNLAFS